MQPYFMPYIGYFQLMKAVDKYIIYDDVNYIKHALTIFDDYKDINCDFLPFGGSGNAKYFIEEIKNNLSPNKKVIVLFDRDGDKGSGGVKGLKDCIAPRPSDGGINDNNTYKRDNFYFLLLPKTDEHKEKDTQFLIEDYFSINSVSYQFCKK